MKENHSEPEHMFSINWKAAESEATEIPDLDSAVSNAWQALESILQYEYADFPELTQYAAYVRQLSVPSPEEGTGDDPQNPILCLQKLNDLLWAVELNRMSSLKKDATQGRRAPLK